MEPVAELLHHRRASGARLGGAPPFSRGSAEVPEWSFQQMKELQQLLARRGFAVGEIDGKLGAATRAGVKAAQLKLGLPANSYPTQDLVERLRGAVATISSHRRNLLPCEREVPSPRRAEGALSARREKVAEGRMRGPSLPRITKSPLTSSAK